MFLFLISYVKNEYDPLYSCAHSTEVFTDLPLTLLLILQSQVLLKMYFGWQMSLPAFAGSLLEVGSDVEKGKLFHKMFILSEADFCLISLRKGNPRRKYLRQIRVQNFHQG